MRKILYIFSTVVLIGVFPSAVSAQQTYEEATDSVKHILSLAKNGDAVAQNEVGGWYYRGRHVKQNYGEALQWWTKSAEKGNIKAIGNMGLCYRTGHGITKDSLKAIRLYQRSIQGGNKALLNQNEELAKKGNEFSNMLVASCYQNGLGVTKDVKKAIPYLTAAAERNCVYAQQELGIILLNEKKATEAASWFKRGAENGDTPCIFYYGKMLVEGLGVNPDKKEGTIYLQNAADAGFPQAIYYVGNCYMNGVGLTKNAEQAVNCYRLAAEKDVHNAQWALAQCYRDGNGTEINYDQALHWYAKAASKGHARAFKNLITDSIAGSPFIAYMNGIKAYTNKNYDEALKQFKVVEKAKVADGRVMEAMILTDPSYSKHNIKKGIKLLNDLSKTNPQAMCLLGNIYYEGRGVEQSYEKAVEWYSKAYAQGHLNENAAKRYAVCYENGWGGLPADKEKAEEILKGDYNSHIPELLRFL